MRHASGHNYKNSSFVVVVAMGQIPRSTERISSSCIDWITVIACWSTSRPICFNASSRSRILWRDSSTDASLGAHHRRTAEPALAACPETCRVQGCRGHVQGLKRPRAALPVVSFYPCCRCAVSTSTPLGVHQPTASAVLPAVHDRTEGVPDRWRSCLERSFI